MVPAVEAMDSNCLMNRTWRHAEKRAAVALYARDRQPSIVMTALQPGKQEMMT